MKKTIAIAIAILLLASGNLWAQDNLNADSASEHLPYVIDVQTPNALHFTTQASAELVDELKFNIELNKNSGPIVDGKVIGMSPFFDMKTSGKNVIYSAKLTCVKTTKGSSCRIH